MVELRLPPSTVLVTVIRGEEVEVPGPRTTIRPGDKVMAVTGVENEDEVLKALTGPTEPLAVTDPQEPGEKVSS